MSLNGLIHTLTETYFVVEIMLYGKSSRIIVCVYIIVEEKIYRKIYEVVEMIVGRKI